VAQAVKDVIGSYEVLVTLFERIQFFLQRLNRYTAIPLIPEMISLLGKIMAQVLSVLALSTKEMQERRIGILLPFVFSFMADYDAENFMKKLVGKKDVEDALERLDMLTREENLMTATRNLEITHHMDVNVKATQGLTHRVDGKVTIIEEVVHSVDGDVKATKELTHDVHENVIAMKEDTRSVHDDVKVTRHGTQLFFTVFHTP
jgi:hypothetical protein